MPVAQERRKELRQSIMASIQYTNDAVTYFSGRTVDISSHGIRFLSHIAYPPGQAIRLNDDTGADDREPAWGIKTNTIAIVRWCRRLDSRKETAFHVGAQFLFGMTTETADNGAGKAPETHFRICAQCYFQCPTNHNFCGNCGHRLKTFDTQVTLLPKVDIQRKYVTILFSDVSGYSAMTERLDPEDVKEIMMRIFVQATQIINRYEGVVERFIGDCLMAVFGMPNAHEDDAVRAVRAAMEIHASVSAEAENIREKTGGSISMHSGINTGLVVTGRTDTTRGSFGLTGDAVNVAARLQDLAQPGEILAGLDTYRQIAGHFSCAPVSLRIVKGRAAPVESYRVLGALDGPRKLQPTGVRRARLIGRDQELEILSAAMDRLQKGEGGVITIRGDAGTGKSRLIGAFKSRVDPETVQWYEGFTYAFAGNIPYFPIIDLLSRTFHIMENDAPEAILGKLETAIRKWTGKTDILPYLGGLFALQFQNTENMQPELWKKKLFDALKTFFSAVAQSRPAVILQEDLHWADPCTVELLHAIIAAMKAPVLFLMVYRPDVSPLINRHLLDIAELGETIHIGELPPHQVAVMVGALLDKVPVSDDLQQLIREKVGGNPFYIEEFVNTLLASGAIVKKGAIWTTRSNDTSFRIPLTIHGIISARIDRLPPDKKRILQEASVIGRTFPYAVLEKITRHPDMLPESLKEYQQLDLIKASPVSGYPAYDFKHVITQEVVYEGLLYKERREIHEQVGRAIETLFSGRLNDFADTLGYHFRKGRSERKAVHYLLEAGKKSLKHYAVDASHQYYQSAYDIVLKASAAETRSGETLIALLNAWAPVFYYRGLFKALETRLAQHRELAEEIRNIEEKGMFYVWMGMCCWGRERFASAYTYLREALKTGNRIGSKRVIGYASVWLPWVCAELGYFAEAVRHSKTAKSMSRFFESDHYPYFSSLDCDGFTNYAQGDVPATGEIGDALLAYSGQIASVRGVTWGHFIKGLSRMNDGDFLSAITSFEMALAVSRDPFYSKFPELSLGMSYLSAGMYAEAEARFAMVNDFARESGCEIIGTAASSFLGGVYMAKGRFGDGMRLMKSARDHWEMNGARWRYGFISLMMGTVFLDFSLHARPLGWRNALRNIFFIVRHYPVASRLAAKYFNDAVGTAESIGAKGIAGQAYLGLARLDARLKRPKSAERNYRAAIRLLADCGAQTFLEQAQKELEKGIPL